MVLAGLDTCRERGHYELIRLFTHDGHNPESAFTGFGIDEGVKLKPFIARKVYVITESGLTQLERKKLEWQDLRSGLDSLLSFSARTA